MLELRRAFESDGDGPRMVAARAALVDEVVRTLWGREVSTDRKLASGVAIAAIGGYGRGKLFPHSDVDLLVCAAKPPAVKDAIRRLSQTLWDSGLQVALVTRAPKDCERFDAANPEFALALLDLRFVAGDEQVVEALERKLRENRRGRDGKRILAELGTLTRDRYAKYGGTLFHLETTAPILQTMIAAFADELRAAGISGEQIAAEGDQYWPALRTIGRNVFDSWSLLAAAAPRSN